MAVLQYTWCVKQGWHILSHIRLVSALACIMQLPTPLVLGGASSFMRIALANTSFTASYASYFR
eukprot:3581903-Pyramimonas_sp.AAC.1